MKTHIAHCSDSYKIISTDNMYKAVEWKTKYVEELRKISHNA